jgi:hypothetical protein
MISNAKFIYRFLFFHKEIVQELIVLVNKTLLNVCFVYVYLVY